MALRSRLRMAPADRDLRVAVRFFFVDVFADAPLSEIRSRSFRMHEGSTGT
jgi:hypothetical protein